MLVVDVDHDRLVGLHPLAVLFLEQHARAADRQLEAFAAHVLDQHAELELAAAGDFEGVLLGAFGDADRDIGLGLALQSFADHAALHLVALTARIGAVVDREGHAQRRRVDFLRVERHGDFRRGDRVGHGRICQARDRDDVARLGMEHGDAIEAFIGEYLGGAARFDHFALQVQCADRHADLEPTALDPAGQDAAEERIAIEQRREHREFAIGIEIGFGDVRDDGLEQRQQVAVAHAVVHARIAGAARGIEHRKIELVVVGVEIDEQVEHLVEHFLRATVGAVDLVDHDDRAQAEAERLAGDELGLRHRAFGGVDQQDHAVDHRQDAFDLGAEIGMAGVSTMLMRIFSPPEGGAHSIEVGLARMVIPRSFSRSFESIARSSTRWLSRKVPDWRKSWSTSVVLPWSTCAMIATLRSEVVMKISVLRVVGGGISLCAAQSGAPLA